MVALRRGAWVFCGTTLTWFDHFRRLDATRPGCRQIDRRDTRIKEE